MLPTFVYLIFLTIVFFANFKLDLTIDKGRNSLHVLGGFVVFLLVFRFNQCISRCHLGNELSANMFASLEFFVLAFCGAIQGSAGLRDQHGTAIEDPDRQRTYTNLALIAKINCVRLSLSLAISFVIHCRLVEAISNNRDGELDNDALVEVVFLCMRLENLLFPYELDLVHTCFHVIKKDHSVQSPVPLHARVLRWLDVVNCIDEKESHFYARVSHSHLGAENDGTHLFGHPVEMGGENLPGEQSVLPLPKLILLMLIDTMRRPSDAPWGYNTRLLGFFFTNTWRIVSSMENLTRLISMPLPLGYRQLCAILALVYTLLYPFINDSKEGIIENIVLPLLVFVALMAFETLASLMEDPLGNEDLDLNLFEMVRGLEVMAEHAFNLSEHHTLRDEIAISGPAREFGFSVCTEKAVEEGVHSFNEFFCWQPIPSIILLNLFRNHGHADDVHKANWRPGSKIRTQLRRSLSKLRGTQHAGSYTRLDTDSDVGMNGCAGMNGCKDDENTLQYHLDARVFVDYIAMRRRAPPQPLNLDDQCQMNNCDPEDLKQTQNRMQICQSLLQEHPASSLFGNTHAEDTDRSAVDHPPPHHKRLTVIESSRRCAAMCPK